MGWLFKKKGEREPGRDAGLSDNGSRGDLYDRVTSGSSASTPSSSTNWSGQPWSKSSSGSADGPPLDVLSFQRHSGSADQSAFVENLSKAWQVLGVNGVNEGLQVLPRPPGGSGPQMPLPMDGSSTPRSAQTSSSRQVYSREDPKSSQPQLREGSSSSQQQPVPVALQSAQRSLGWRNEADVRVVAPPPARPAAFDIKLQFAKPLEPGSQEAHRPAEKELSARQLLRNIAAASVSDPPPQQQGLWQPRQEKVGKEKEREPLTPPRQAAGHGHAAPQQLVPLARPAICRSFSYQELRTACRNFKPECLLGEGGFGRVYKGKLDTGQVVAVKQLDHDGMQGHREFMTEVNMLRQCFHPNLVTLLGFCAEGEQRLLVYEYMSRGSLEHQLFDRPPGEKALPWAHRMRIALGAAMGLEYLHDTSNGKTPVIFRDFKASNVLLDKSWNAKLSDFGLARDGPTGDRTHVSTRVMGTYGYCAPEYVITGHLTPRSDTYSFGVVLLELLTGRLAMDKTRPSGEVNLVKWAQPFLADRGKVYKMMDQRLEGHFNPKSALRAATLADMCLQESPKARPLMSQVVQALQTLQESPPELSPPHPEAVKARQRGPFEPPSPVSDRGHDDSSGSSRRQSGDHGIAGSLVRAAMARPFTPRSPAYG